MATISRNALTCALTRALEGAAGSPDIAPSMAVERIMTKEGFVPREHEGESPLSRFLSWVARDPVDFILVAAPGFSKDLKIATGRNRDEWAALIGGRA